MRVTSAPLQRAAPHLLFVDADTWLAPGALGALLAEHERRGGLVSVQPYHVVERPHEGLSAYPNAVAVLAAAGGAVAFGPCMLTSAVDYRRAGGHAAVAKEVVEDVALAARYRSAGLPVTCLIGGTLVRFRMYPQGPRQLIDGWSKNLAAGAGRADLWAAAATAVWITAHVAVTLDLVRALTGRLLHGTSVPAMPVAAAVAVVAHQLWLLRRIGSFRWWTAAAFPLPLGGFLTIFGRSALLLMSGREVTWRGRRIRACRSSSCHGPPWWWSTSPPGPPSTRCPATTSTGFESRICSTTPGCWRPGGSSKAGASTGTCSRSTGGRIDSRRRGRSARVA